MSADHLYGQYLSHLEIRNLEVPFGSGLTNAKLWLVSKFIAEKMFFFLWKLSKNIFSPNFWKLCFPKFWKIIFKLTFFGINFETIPVLKWSILTIEDKLSITARALNRFSKRLTMIEHLKRTCSNTGNMFGNIQDGNDFLGFHLLEIFRFFTKNQP